MVGFLATKEVTTTDFIEKVMPEVEKFIEEKDRLNYKLVIETDLSRFTYDAWFQDAILEIKILISGIVQLFLFLILNFLKFI
jgi:hypothetical protein